MSDRSDPPTRTGRALRLTVDGEAPIVVDESVGSGSTPEAREAVGVTQLTGLPAERADGVRRFEAVVDGWRFEVTAESAERAAIRERATRTQQQGRHVREVVRARIPGRVVRVWVAAGDAVEAGQRLLAVEAMKMENEVRASHAGTVESVAVAVGQTVELGDELVVVA